MDFRSRIRRHCKARLQRAHLPPWPAGPILIIGGALPKLERHVFVCTNQRPAGSPKGCCADKGSEEIRAAFKANIAERGLRSRIRANSAGCLDACEYGPAVVVYPEAVWYAGVTLADVDEIVQRHLIGGEVVERLVLREPA